MPYHKDDGQYVYSIRGQERFRSPRIAVFFDNETGTLLKHGLADYVEKYAEDVRRRYQERGMAELAEKFTLMSSSEWLIKDLNKIVEISGYVKFFSDEMLIHGPVVQND